MPASGGHILMGCRVRVNSSMPRDCPSDLSLLLPEVETLLAPSRLQIFNWGIDASSAKSALNDF